MPVSLLPTLYSTRAYGKPSQFNTGDATSFRKAVDMTDDELAAIVARAKLTVIKTDWRTGRWRAFCGAGVSRRFPIGTADKGSSIQPDRLLVIPPGEDRR